MQGRQFLRVDDLPVLATVYRTRKVSACTIRPPSLNYEVRYATYFVPCVMSPEIGRREGLRLSRSGVAIIISLETRAMEVEVGDSLIAHDVVTLVE